MVGMLSRDELAVRCSISFCALCTRARQTELVYDGHGGLHDKTFVGVAPDK